MLASIIPTSILPWPCWKNPASSLLVHGRTVPLPPPCPFAASTTSRLAPVPRGYLFPSPSSSYSLLVRYPEPPSFRPFSNPFATRQPALFLFRCRERVQGRDSAKELVRFSIFSVRRPTGLKDGTEVGGLSTDTELKSVHRAGKWNLLRRPSIRSTLFSLFFFSSFFYFFLFNKYLFLFRSFDARFSFLLPLSLSVTWQIEIDAVHDTMERVSPRVEHAIDLFVSGESNESLKDNITLGFGKIDFFFTIYKL